MYFARAAILALAAALAQACTQCTHPGNFVGARMFIFPYETRIQKLTKGSKRMVGPNRLRFMLRGGPGQRSQYSREFLGSS